MSNDESDVRLKYAAVFVDGGPKIIRVERCPRTGYWKPTEECGVLAFSELGLHPTPARAAFAAFAERRSAEYELRAAVNELTARLDRVISERISLGRLHRSLLVESESGD